MLVGRGSYREDLCIYIMNFWCRHSRHSHVIKLSLFTATKGINHSARWHRNSDERSYLTYYIWSIGTPIWRPKMIIKRGQKDHSSHSKDSWFLNNYKRKEQETLYFFAIMFSSKGLIRVGTETHLWHLSHVCAHRVELRKICGREPDVVNFK